MIPQSFIQELLARVDVVEVVGKHVKLKKSGANWMGLCPFHNEKSPSFSVSPTKQFYHCFGCGAHGSAIGFLMEHAGLGYVDAIEDLAQSVGLQVPQEPGRGRRGDAAAEAPDLVEQLALAARFYKSRLKDAPRAVDYLKARGLTGETALRYGLGYAPDGWRPLEAAFADYDSPTLVAAGLVIEGEGDEGRKKRYDRFRDRIMFPIRDSRGRVVGFGGRVLDKGEPKYLNSPETPVFSKGRELYGLFEARDALRREDCAIVVEGYMDVVMLSQHGVGNAVATLGTATTPQHVGKLLRLVDRVVFAFDGDAAGRKAAWRALEASLPQVQDTKRVDFLFLPPEHDPDSFVRDHGEAGWRDALAGALPLSEFLVRGLAEQVDLATPEGRARLQAEARPLLLALSAFALRQQITQRVATLVGITGAQLERYLAQEGAAAHSVGQGRAVGDPASPARFGASRPAVGAPSEGGAAAPGRGAAGYTAGGQAHAPQPGAGRGGPRRGDVSGGPGGGWAPGRADGGAGGRTGGWRGGPRDGGRGGGAAGFGDRSPRAALPDAQRRARILAALTPALAAEWRDEVAALGDAAGAQWLPDELVDWLQRVAALPPGSTYATLRETIAADDPEQGEALDRETADDGVRGAALAQLTPEEARADFRGAIAQVQLRAIDRELSELPQQGFAPEALRERWIELEAAKASLKARRDAPASA